MRALILGLALLVPLLAVQGCFEFDEPICSYKCGGGTTCPDEYECRADGYCHLEGSTETCPFTDAATPFDLAIPDLTSLPDLAGNLDAASID